MSNPSSNKPQEAIPPVSEPIRSTDSTSAAKTVGQDFAREADGREQGALLELWDFLRYSKKWWLTPIFVALLLIGIFLVLSTTAAAPFIYTLF